MNIIQLSNPIEVETPLGKGRAIGWIDYGPELNTVWKVVLDEDGRVRNFFDTEVYVYPNLMAGGAIKLPKNFKK